MSPGKLAALVGVNLARDKKGAAFSAFGVAIGVGALVFFVALGQGVNSIVRERIFPVDAAAVEVVPSSMTFSILGGGKLDEATVARLEALPGVERVYRKMDLRVPAMGGPAENLVQAFKVPARVYLAIIATGVEPEYVAKDVAPGAKFEDGGAGKAIPAIAARRLLEMYNKSFARSQGLVPIGEGMLNQAAGMELLTATLGRSMRGATGMPERKVGLAYAGLSDRAPLQGVLIPLETARRINKEYGVDAETYSAASVLADSPGRVPAVVQAVKEMGLSIDDTEKKLAENVGAAVAITTAAMALLSALICLLAAVNIAHALSASVRNRAKEIGLLRAVGATKRDVSFIVLGEATLIGFLGGLAGTLGARLVGLLIDWLAKTRLPEFPFKPDTFFGFSATLLVLAVLLGAVASLLGALMPAVAASRTDPARALAG